MKSSGIASFERARRGRHVRACRQKVMAHISQRIRAVRQPGFLRAVVVRGNRVSAGVASRNVLPSVFFGGDNNTRLKIVMPPCSPILPVQPAILAPVANVYFIESAKASRRPAAHPWRSHLPRTRRPCRPCKNSPRRMPADQDEPSPRARPAPSA